MLIYVIYPGWFSLVYSFICLVTPYIMQVNFSLKYIVYKNTTNKHSSNQYNIINNYKTF